MYSTVCVTSVWPSRLFSSIWGVIIVSIQFIGPVIILIYCYGKIAWILTRRIDSNLESNNSMAEGDKIINSEFLKARNNTIKTVLLVGICFIICWVNDEAYYLMYNFGYDVDWNGPYFKFCVAMIYLNCTVNPFVYLISYQDYQRVLREFCFKPKSVGRDTESTSSVSTETISTHNNQWSEKKPFQALILLNVQSIVRLFVSSSFVNVITRSTVR